MRRWRLETPEHTLEGSQERETAHRAGRVVEQQPGVRTRRETPNELRRLVGLRRVEALDIGEDVDLGLAGRRRVRYVG